MIIEQNLNKLFRQLNHNDTAKVTLGGNDILIRVFDDASKISLATTVYYGGNFIPKSVRMGVVSKKTPFNHSPIKTSLAIDENHYQINLNYLGHLEHMNNQNFLELLEEFTRLAHAWRAYLDEHDKNDLVYVRI